MGDNEIRMFKVDRGRNGDVTCAILCNGETHFLCRRGLEDVPHKFAEDNTNCDSARCQGPDSEAVDISVLSIRDQRKLGLTAIVPPGLVLLAENPDGSWNPTAAYSSGEEIVPKQLESGTTLRNGEGATYSHYTDRYVREQVFYVRNVCGRANERRVGPTESWRTQKKLQKLREGERGSVAVAA